MTVRALAVAAALTLATGGVANADDPQPDLAAVVAERDQLRADLAEAYADRDGWIARAMTAETPPAPPAAPPVGPVTVFVADHTNRTIDLRTPLLLAEQAWNVNGRVRFQPARTCAFRTNCVDIVSVHAGPTWWGAVAENVGGGRWIITVNYDTIPTTKSGMRGLACHELGHVLGMDHRADVVDGCLWAGHPPRPTAAQLEQVRTGQVVEPSTTAAR